MSAKDIGLNEKLPRIKPPGPLRVWEVFEKIGQDGRLIRFTIQEIPEDRYEDAVDHMCTYFLADEATCQCLKAKDDPVFIENSKVMWRQVLQQDISIAAFIDNPDGGKPIIAGMNVLGVEFKDMQKSIHDLKFTSDKLETIFKVVMDLTKKAQVYERYGVNNYMFALGLSVLPAYRGYGLGTRLLRARDVIGRAYNIPATSTAFTSTISQKTAERANFEELLEKDYANIVHENGKECFPGIKYKTIKIMAKRLLPAQSSL